ncbi:MAG TPA: hypothetical protein HA359_04290 [Candidatus Poseidoniaceae archaeon]|nr:MAG TPA: hypothetical protein D7H84_04290 [Candidatus Poseidoniales archaeon]DAC57938.1 MAG TPA: hypothetical protein D7I03_06540 [Candidatus Poseidoniales archaeon]HII23458.1 hypothetical protein [Candidatus Poseidoniaceae archaeon]HII50983.1 hypothetical protein [Candidatus Poseidoniaceae archaeon]|tara:strand:- start:382 stop:1293 length:912 start_codon:yes stop_codon:yes gene_type:complete
MNGRNRRRKDVPFNPFAQNAAAERNRRHAEKAKEKRRQENQINSAEASSTKPSQNKSLEDLQREARKKIGSEIKTTEEKKDLQTAKQPVVQKPVEEKVIAPKITQTTAAKTVTEKKPSREERLAELKRKSQQSKDNAKLRKSTTKQEMAPQVETVEESDEVKEIEADIPELNSTDETLDGYSGKNLNVFKTIQIVDKSSAGISKKKRKTRRMDKKGGGRQRLEKKLNKQKILEFRYVARDILDNPDVPEEHRSNVLGQIIAKGERISIDAAMEFIDQKTLELVLTEEISEQLKNEIKSISKRR